MSGAYSVRMFSILEASKHWPLCRRIQAQACKIRYLQKSCTVQPTPPS